LERAKRFVKWVYQDSQNKSNWLMEDKNTVIDLQLQTYLPWHKARITFLELLIMPLIRTRITASMLLALQIELLVAIFDGYKGFLVNLSLILT
jgi:hypothetical protein